MVAARAVLLSGALGLAFHATVPAQGHSKSETEPNDSLRTANIVVLGDTISGTIAPNGERDMFVIQLDSGVALHVRGSAAGSPIVPHLELWDPRGNTLQETGPTDPGHDADIWFRITKPGQYAIRFRNEKDGGGPSYTYRLMFRDEAPPRLGPGDPNKLVATNVQGAMVAAPNGDFFVADARRGRIARVTTSGVVTTFASVTGPIGIKGLALDRDGNVLVTGDSGFGGVIWRISPSAVRSVFYYQPNSIYGRGYLDAIAVAPNGDVWVGHDGSILQLDPQGNLKATIPSGCAFHYSMAFSPAGELHYVGEGDECGGVRKLAGNTSPQTVFGGLYRQALVFDRDGYLYLMDGGGEGKIVLLDPQYHVVHDPFASNLGDYAAAAGGLAFAQDGSGGTTARLFLAYGGAGSDSWFIEMNPAGIRAPGWPVGAQTNQTTQLKVTGRALRAGIVGKAYSDTLKTTDAPGAVTWNVASGTLPSGITLDAAHGILSGSPTDSGSFAFDARATSGGQSATGHFTLHVTREQLMQIEIDAIATALLGGPALTTDQVQYLDQHGNNNGILDVGDLRAYLRARGVLVGGQQP